MTLIGIGALYKSLYSCPFTIMWTFFSAWGWALGVFAFMLIVGTALSRLPTKITGYSSVVAAALVMLCWFPTLDPKMLSPDIGKFVSLEGKGTPPELIFDTRTNYLNARATVLWLYKHSKPFTTSHRKWPHNLPPIYAPKYPYPVCVIKMREECEGPQRGQRNDLLKRIEQVGYSQLRFSLHRPNTPDHSKVFSSEPSTYRADRFGHLQWRPL